MSVELQATSNGSNAFQWNSIVRDIDNLSHNNIHRSDELDDAISLSLSLSLSLIYDHVRACAILYMKLVIRIGSKGITKDCKTGWSIEVVQHDLGERRVET